jgi:hypothetical protein
MVTGGGGENFVGKSLSAVGTFETGRLGLPTRRKIKGSPGWAPSSGKLSYYTKGST